MTGGIEAGPRMLTGDTTPRQASGLRQRAAQNPTVPLLASAVIASGTLLLTLGARLTFLFDDWAFLLLRPGWSVDALLNPHNEHIALIPVAIYKVLLATFGMGSAFPFRVVSTLLFLTSAVLLYAYLRRRVDEWLALAGTVLILFLGAAYEDLLWEFQMAFFGSMVAGLGMLLVLERRDRVGDRLACGLLTISMAFSSLGLSFAAGAAVEIMLRRDRWRRLWIVAIPGLLFAIWWLGWGHKADNAISLHNFGLLPLFVANAIATALSSMLGLSTPTPESVIVSPDLTVAALDWGRPLLVGAVGLAGWRLYKLGRIPRWLWIAAAIGISFWVLAALNAKPGRTATAGRYQYVSAVFILLIAAELLRGVRIGRRGLAVLAVAVALIVVSNVTLLHQGYKTFRSVGQIEQADLGALDIARGAVDPAFLVNEENGDLPFALTNAGPYFTAADDFGSPAFTPSEIASAPEQARVAADKVLAAALNLKLAPAPTRPRATGPAPVLKGPPTALSGKGASCVTVKVARADAPLLQVPPGGVVLKAAKKGEAEVRLRRFAQQSLPVDLGRLKGGATDLLGIPTDRSNVPWKLSLQGSGPVTVCGLGPAAPST